MTSTVKSVRSESDEKFERETPSVATFSQERYRRRRNRWAGSRCEPRFDRTGRRVGSRRWGGTRPPTSPVDHAQQYNWEAIAEQAETAYQRAIDGTW